MPDAKGRPSAEELAEEDALVENPSPPESVEPPFSPEPSSEPVPARTEAHGGPDAEAANAPSDVTVGVDGEPLPEFDARVREEFEGLLYLGYLTRSFVWAGHRFVIRSLLIDQTLEVGLIVKEYADSISDLKAYQSAVCAGCIVSIDGKALPAPLSDNPADTPLKNAFDYIVSNWFSPTLDAVYQEFLKLEETVLLVVKAMADAAPLVPGVTGPASGMATSNSNS